MGTDLKKERAPSPNSSHPLLCASPVALLWQLTQRSQPRVLVHPLVLCAKSARPSEAQQVLPWMEVGAATQDSPRRNIRSLSCKAGEAALHPLLPPTCTAPHLHCPVSHSRGRESHITGPQVSASEGAAGGGAPEGQEKERCAGKWGTAAKPTDTDPGEEVGCRRCRVQSPDSWQTGAHQKVLPSTRLVTTVGLILFQIISKNIRPITREAGLE